MASNVYRNKFEIKNWTKNLSFSTYETVLEVINNTKFKLEVSETDLKISLIGSDIMEFKADFEIRLSGKLWQTLTFLKSDQSHSDWLKLSYARRRSHPCNESFTIILLLVKDCLDNSYDQLRANQNRYLLNGFVSDFKTQFESNSSTDFTICVKDREFSVHSQILSARSPVFRAMLTNDMKEKNEMKATLHDIEPEIFETLLKFINYCEVSEIDSMTDSDRKALIKAADVYEIRDLSHFVVTKMFTHLTVENIREAKDYGAEYCNIDLNNRCLEFEVENRAALIQPLSIDYL